MIFVAIAIGVWAVARTGYHGWPTPAGRPSVRRSLGLRTATGFIAFFG